MRRFGVGQGLDDAIPGQHVGEPGRLYEASLGRYGITDGRAIAAVTGEAVDSAPTGAERERTDQREVRMARRYVDCREVPSDMNCTVGIAADSDDELVEAAVQHAIAVHSHEDTPELRSMIRQGIKDTHAAAV